jgi:hypothetical protein
MDARTLQRLLIGAVAAACGGLTTEGEPSKTRAGPHRETDEARASDPFVDAGEPDVVDGGADAGSDASEPRFDRPFDCSAHAGYPLLRAALGVDYLELRRATTMTLDGGRSWTVTTSDGAKCETATSKGACEAALNQASSSVYLFGECSGCLPGGNYLAYTDGDTVGTIASVAELVSVGAASIRRKKHGWSRSRTVTRRRAMAIGSPCGRMASWFARRR